MLSQTTPMPREHSDLFRNLLRIAECQPAVLRQTDGCYAAIFSVHGLAHYQNCHSLPENNPLSRTHNSLMMIASEIGRLLSRGKQGLPEQCTNVVLMSPNSGLGGSSYLFAVARGSSPLLLAIKHYHGGHGVAGTVEVMDCSSSFLADVVKGVTRRLSSMDSDGGQPH